MIKTPLKLEEPSDYGFTVEAYPSEEQPDTLVLTDASGDEIWLSQVQLDKLARANGYVKPVDVRTVVEGQGNTFGTDDGFRWPEHQAALRMLTDERLRQYKKWGNQRLTKDTGYVVLAEEYGEVARAILEKNEDDYLAELIQTAAVALQLAEDVLEARGYSKPKSGPVDLF